MILDEIESGIVLIEKLRILIPIWIERAKKLGELTPEKEAEYQKRQADVFNQPYAKVLPEDVPPQPS